MGEARTLAKLVERFCSMDEAQPGHVNISIIHNDAPNAATIQRDDIWCIQLRDTQTVRDLIWEYGQQFPDKGAILLTTLPTGDCLEDETVLASVCDLSYKSLIVLKAWTKNFLDHVPKTDANKVIKSLFDLYATLQAVKHPANKNMQQIITNQWQNLSSDQVVLLLRQKQCIGEIANDPTDLRAFCILYEQLATEGSFVRLSQSSVDTEARVRIALQHWRIQTQPERKALKCRAALQFRRFAVPALPALGPSIRLLENGSDVDLESEEFSFNDVVGGDTIAVNDQSLEALEAQAKNHLNLLESIHGCLSSGSITTVQKSWLAQLECLLQQKAEYRTKIGFVGSTGSGKSSIINALLGEASLVPTSNWRACTAAAIEISYNQFAGSPYRGIVHIISREEWETELRALISDLPKDDTPVNQDSDSQSAEAGIALAKIAVVCPSIDMSCISRSTVQKLLDHENVAKLLGTQIPLTAGTSEAFSHALSKFVDSKDRSKSATPQEPALWPIVKYVEIFTKSLLLENGMVLIDLPGTSDSNRARAQKAKEYMKTCSNLFIVAPLTRAVDDKSAKDILDESFKRQMKLDGTYDKAVVVGSKSDDVSCEDGDVVSLGIEAQIKALKQEQTLLTDQLFNLENNLGSVEKLYDEEVQKAEELGKHADIYNALLTQAKKFGSVLEPRPAERKRKQAASSGVSTGRKKPYQRRNLSNDDSEEFESGPAAHQRTLSQNDIEVKLEDIKREYVRACSSISNFEQEIATLEPRITALKATAKGREGVQWRLCVRARNDKMRQTMRNDFATSLKEYEQHIAAQAPDFDPDVKMKDYRVVADQLPVFCVSSKGYQRLAGLSKERSCIDQFSDKMQTEIPALYNYATDLARVSRKKYLDRFITDAALMITTIKMWAIDTRSDGGATQKEVIRNQEIFTRGFEVLRKNLDSSMSNCVRSNKHDIRFGIIDKLPNTQGRTCLRVHKISTEWRILAWQTYRATCVHDGEFFQRGKKIWIDFNDQLTIPILEAIIMGWDSVFQIQIPRNINCAITSFKEALTEFRTTFEQIGRNLSIDKELMEMLESQLSRYRDSLLNGFDRLQQYIVAEQKDLSRSLSPAVQSSMQPAYKDASTQKGPGTLNRMCQIVEQRVKAMSKPLFAELSSHVITELERILRTSENNLQAPTSGALSRMEQDYLNMFSSRIKQLTDEQRPLKDRILDIMERSERTSTYGAESISNIKIENPTL